MYLAKRGGLTDEEVRAIVKDFTARVRPELQKRYDYYRGKQKILGKKASDVGKPCNRIVCNFVESIVNTYEGYALGNPVAYTSEVNLEPLMDCLRYNDVTDEDSELFRIALIYGISPEIYYIDEDAKVRFKTLDPRDVIPVYENNLNGELIYAIRLWEEKLPEDLNPKQYIQLYDDTFVRTYTSTVGYAGLNLIDEQPHYYGQVPFTFYNLNHEGTGVADSIFSLQDAYNSLISDSIDDWDSFCDAYLVFKGLDVDLDDLADMKSKRALLLDADCSAEYLVKNTQTTEIENLLSTVEGKIRELSACPDFNNETFGTSSGIAIRYRLQAMENNVAGMLNNFRKALQRRLELLANVISLTSGEQAWRDVKIEFTRNLPVNLTDTVQVVTQLKDIVSHKTLLSLLPFVDDVEAELARLSEEGFQAQTPVETL